MDDIATKIADAILNTIERQQRINRDDIAEAAAGVIGAMACDSETISDYIKQYRAAAMSRPKV